QAANVGLSLRETLGQVLGLTQDRDANNVAAACHWQTLPLLTSVLFLHGLDERTYLYLRQRVVLGRLHPRRQTEHGLVLGLLLEQLERRRGEPQVHSSPSSRSSEPLRAAR